MFIINKKLLGIVIIEILLFAIVITSTHLYDINKVPRIYNINELTEDLLIRDIKLVSFGNNVYVQSNYNFEKYNTKAKINNIYLGISVGNKNIIDLSLGNVFVKSNKYFIDLNDIKKGIKISDNSKLKVHISYKVNGVKKDLYDTIKLKDHKYEN